MVKVRQGYNRKEAIQKIKAELKKGISFLKCRKCGCMKDVLRTLLSSLFSIEEKKSSQLLQNIKSWLKLIKATEYACLGCKHCYPAVAINIFNQTFPETIEAQLPTCDTEVKPQKWPAVAGEYFAFCEGATCPVAVSTLASVTLAEDLAKIKSKGLCIVGKTETENIGIDKIIKNTIANPTIRFLIVTGRDSLGHQSGKTLLALYRNGVDKNMKVMGTPARHPVLKNVTLGEVEAFRKQVKLIDMIGCEDIKAIAEKIAVLSKETILTCESKEGVRKVSTIQISSTAKIVAGSLKKVKMDKAGYFVIIPSFKDKVIIVEHYSYDHKLLHTIEGKDAVSLYSPIVEKGWVRELSHAAYLGRELTKAELSLKYGFKYVQDAAGNVNEKR